MNSSNKHRSVLDAGRFSGLALRLSAAAGGLLALQPVLHAHPGHTWSDATYQHLLTSPYHAAALALGGCGLWVAGRLLRRTWQRRSLQALGVAALVAACGLLSN